MGKELGELFFTEWLELIGGEGARWAHLVHYKVDVCWSEGDAFQDQALLRPSIEFEGNLPYLSLSDGNHSAAEWLDRSGGEHDMSPTTGRSIMAVGGGFGGARDVGGRVQRWPQGGGGAHPT